MDRAKGHRRTDTLVEAVKAGLATMPTDDVLTTAQNLLGVLGYRSSRTLHGQSGNVDDFIGQFPAPKSNTATEQAFRENVQSVQFVFQLTSDEIASAKPPTPGLETASFDTGHPQSFFFFAVELKEANYARSKYAEFTRELNKRLIAPTVVLFTTQQGRLTLAFVHRRQHKHDPSRDVLGSVSLVRDINPTQPHRAHLDILAELSLEHLLSWMSDHNKPHDFDGLLAAWLNALNTEALNKRFYTELFDWFEWTVGEATFPTQEQKVLPPEEHSIRLITRLLFVWFIKEKRLIAEDLFNETKIADLLKNYDRDTGDSYYRAVLQNLFFATLNTEIDKRGFSKEKDSTHRNFSLYRYKSEISDPEKLLALFARTPFINGGLFDCLDSEEGIRDGGYRIDCFSDNERHYTKLSLPNRLFFGEHGLIPLFNRYKFTVEENTPVEQEVALDPELLGKVFENLLAAYNPETRQTARKQTGSYYTPRPVVDYMVDEALLASLAQQCRPTDGAATFWQERLRYLLNYEDAFSDADELFDKDEAAGIVRTIAGLKILDPAVGSGAFPMGVLHKLTLALRRIDPDNTRWATLQKERAREKADAAFETKDRHERDAELLEISETFEKYAGDFGRKLYLIQNSIFGVDIQPIACQIAKLRFFISLAIEQEANNNPNDNYGIKPLPNLETRFIAADTLLKLSGERMLTSEKAQILEHQLLENRERHFHATTRQKKLAYKKEDKRLRGELAQALESLGFPTDDANKIAHWDPYDQNATAAWFDAEYMFGVTGGFDVVLGNPPYIQLQKNGGTLGRKYAGQDFQTFVRSGDIYQLFYERAGQLLSDQGHLCFITSNSWLKAKYGEKLRRYFTDKHTPMKLLEMGKDIFENAIVDNNILLVRAGKSDTVGSAVDVERLPDQTFPPAEKLWGKLRLRDSEPWMALSAVERGIMDKMQAIGTPLKEWDIAINYGIKTGYNAAFIVDKKTKNALVAEDPRSEELLKPILRGRDIKRYRVEWARLWVIDSHNGYGDVPPINVDDYIAIKRHLDQFYPQLKKRQDKGITPYNLRHCAYHEEFLRDKLVWMDLSPQGRFAYSNEEVYCNNKAFLMIGFPLKYLCAVLNSTIVTWLVNKTARTTGVGLTQWEKFTVEAIPIPNIPAIEQHPFIRLIDRIL